MVFISIHKFGLLYQLLRAVEINGTQNEHFQYNRYAMPERKYSLKWSKYLPYSYSAIKLRKL